MSLATVLGKLREAMFMRASGQDEEDAPPSRHACEGGDMGVEQILLLGSFFLKSLPVCGRPSSDGSLVAFIGRMASRLPGIPAAKAHGRLSRGGPGTGCQPWPANRQG